MYFVIIRITYCAYDENYFLLIGNLITQHYTTWSKNFRKNFCMAFYR